jgi:YbgC/YbaW family acyl-CoA thioester hydrolase
MASSFKIVRTVEFCETDAAGIMHFTNFFRFMEACEHAFIRSLGLTIFERSADPQVGWPRVACSAEYKRPLRFEDRVEVELSVAAKSEKSLTYAFTLRKEGEKDIAATGSMTVVCVTVREGRLQATFIPRNFFDRIEVASNG